MILVQLRDIIKPLVLLAIFAWPAGMVLSQSFVGGNGDGYGSKISAVALGVTVDRFGGGSDDGYSSNESATFSSGDDKYQGAVGDGYSFDISMEFSYSPLKYQGTFGDGYAAAVSNLIKTHSAYTSPLPSNTGSTEISKREVIDPFDGLRVYPNPFTDILRLEIYSTTTATLSLRVFNMLGELVYSQEVNVSAGHHHEEVNPGNLTPGTYLLNLNLNTGEEQWRSQLRVIRLSN